MPKKTAADQLTGGYREDAAVTTYLGYPGGGVAQVIGPEAHQPEGATVITRAEYEGRLAALKADHDAYVERLAHEDRSRLAADLRALRAAGIPEDTGRRLVGWNIELFGEPPA